MIKSGVRVCLRVMDYNMDGELPLKIIWKGWEIVFIPACCITSKQWLQCMRHAAAAEFLISRGMTQRWTSIEGAHGACASRTERAYHTGWPSPKNFIVDGHCHCRLGAIYIRFPVHTVVLYNTSTTPNKQKALAKWDLMDWDMPLLRARRYGGTICQSRSLLLG